MARKTSKMRPRRDYRPAIGSLESRKLLAIDAQAILSRPLGIPAAAVDARVDSDAFSSAMGQINNAGHPRPNSANLAAPWGPSAALEPPYPAPLTSRPLAAAGSGRAGSIPITLPADGPHMIATGPAPAIRPYVGKARSAVAQPQAGPAMNMMMAQAMSGSGSGGSQSGSGSGSSQSGSSSGSYQSWSSESSGSSGSSASGPDGDGGTFSYSNVMTWDYIWTWDSDGNSSYTSHTTTTMSYSDSGTTPDGVSYNFSGGENGQSDSSTVTQSDGTSHSENSSTTDSHYTIHEDDGQGNTFDGGGTSHSTSQGQGDTVAGAITGNSSSDSSTANHYTAHSEDGSSTLDESGSDWTTDHSDGTLYLLAWDVLGTSTSNTTHDDGGSDSGSMNISDDSGDTEDSGYFNEYTDHSESQVSNDWINEIFSYTASANSSDDGNGHYDVSLSDGDSTESYGSSSNYQDQSQSSTDATGASTSSYSGSASGNDYGSTSIADDVGDTSSGGYNDQFSAQYQGGTNADGTSYSSYSDTGSGGDHGSMNLVNGADTLGTSTHDTYSYTASGGINSDGSVYGTSSGSASGGGTFSLHEQDDAGDSLDESGSFGYQEQDNNGDDSESENGTENYTLTTAANGTASGTSGYSQSRDTSEDGSILSGLLLGKIEGKKAKQVPQQWTTLTDTAGNSYSVENAAQLRNALISIKTQGLMIDDLNIKGHGWDYGIQLTDGTNPDQMSCQGGVIFINNVDVTQLLDDVTDSRSRILFAGCDTGPFAQSVSAALGDDTRVVGNTLRYAVGIPFTPLTFGWYETYVNGSPGDWGGD